MVEARNWDGVFVADFASERARLRKAKMVCFGRCAATNGLPRYEFAVFLIAQTDHVNWQAPSSAGDFLKRLCGRIALAFRAVRNAGRDFDILALKHRRRHVFV
jgi:hypothetical protein